jgi:hypothetical protein
MIIWQFDKLAIYRYHRFFYYRSILIYLYNQKRLSLRDVEISVMSV